MNDTNRALNRTVLIIIGILLLGVGAVVVLAAVWPVAAETWTVATEAGRSWLEQALDGTAIAGSTLSWIVLGVLAVIVLLIALLIITLTRLGGGRSRTILRSGTHDGPRGRVIVRSGFVSDALQHSLDARDDILFSSVTASDVRDQPVLHVSVTPRQNTSPAQVREDVDRLLANLSTLTGEDLPTFVSIRSGLRARLAHDQRRLA